MGCLRETEAASLPVMVQPARSRLVELSNRIRSLNTLLSSFLPPLFFWAFFWLVFFLGGKGVVKFS